MCAFVSQLVLKIRKRANPDKLVYMSSLLCECSCHWTQYQLLCVSFTFSLWLDGVLPLVMDRETTAQEKCFQILEDVLISNIVPQSKLVKGMFFGASFSAMS